MKVVVVLPAHHRPIVGAGGAAVRVWCDVVDLAPRGGYFTTRDDAASVPNCDGVPLMVIEGPPARDKGNDTTIRLL